MIAKIRAMRKLSKEFRMQADSLQEIRRGLDRMAFDFGDFRVGNRPVSEGHVINAALLLMMGMPEEKRLEAAKAAFEKLNALLAIDEPESWQSAEIIERGRPAEPDVIAEPVRPTPRPKRKGAG